MAIEAILEPLQIGAKIRVGDWWKSAAGYWEQRESVGWFERMTVRHAKHYRLTGLWESVRKPLGTSSEHQT